MAIKTVKYVGFAENAGKSRTETYDEMYGKCTPSTGNKPVRSPYWLGLPYNEQVLKGDAAMARLMLPIWGPNNDQKFQDILPLFTKVEPPTISVSNWKKFPDVKPPVDDTIMYNTKRGNINFMEMPYDEFFWTAFGVELWKKVGDPESISVPNPAYPEYLANVQLYNQILHDTFLLMATYQFPALPCTGSWKWYQGDTPTTLLEIPQDCAHELAMPTATGWKMILRVMPVADQANSSIWNNFINNSMLYCPPQYPADYRVRKLTTQIG